MKTQSSIRTRILYLVQLALLTAIVILFQMMGTFIKIGPTSVSLVLLPIAVGAVLLGPGAGAFLGGVFGFITLWAGISGADGFTNILFNAQPLATAIICLGKGILCGFVAGLIHRLLERFSPALAIILASASVPIVNTGLFILGGLTLVSETLSANFVDGTTLVYFLVIVCAGLNFVAEFLLNLVVSPVINTIVYVIRHQLSHPTHH